VFWDENIFTPHPTTLYRGLNLLNLLKLLQEQLEEVPYIFPKSLATRKTLQHRLYIRVSLPTPFAKCGGWGPPPGAREHRELFFLKIKTGALSYHLRRRSNFTSRDEANTTTTTHANNAPNKTLHHLILGESQREGTKDCAGEATVCHA
jgi:hypothetical protein